MRNRLHEQPALWSTTSPSARFPGPLQRDGVTARGVDKVAAATRMGACPPNPATPPMTSTPPASPALPLQGDPVRPSVPHRALALGTVCFGIVIVMTDMTSMTVALPVLRDTFDASTADIVWVILLNPFSVVALSMSLGRLGDIYGRRWFYTTGFALVGVGLAIASLAGSLEELIGARVLGAVGMAMIMSNAAAVISAAYPPQERSRALGLMAASVGVGWAAGPLIGGGILEIGDWRALLWVRAPFALAGAVVAGAVLRDPPRDERPSGLDPFGAVALTLMLFSLVLGINRGEVWG